CLKGINFTYFGDARFNMGNSLMVACAKMGLNYTACAPKAFWPEKELIDTCIQLAKESGGSVRMTEDPSEGAKNADVLYTDIWVSMGEPKEAWKERIGLLKDYQVNNALMAQAKPDAIFMHCLPSFHDTKTTIGKEIFEQYGLSGLEVSDDVFNGSQSVVFDEAENRMHTIKAVMYATLKDKP
ncbi:MAG: ornithine carbamoyltransferase, partial [Parasporobacterium sp.]|nr:ornithine carbamoyltransferase [Parasporobacterium sp.]